MMSEPGLTMGEPDLSSFDVTLRPLVGMSRVQLAGSVPDGFLVRKEDRIYDVLVLDVSCPLCYARVQPMIGDWTRGGAYLHQNDDVLHRMSMVVPARMGWNVLVVFEEWPFGKAIAQRDDTDFHVVLRVTSRPMPPGYVAHVE